MDHLPPRPLEYVDAIQMLLGIGAAVLAEVVAAVHLDCGAFPVCCVVKDEIESLFSARLNLVVQFHLAAVARGIDEPVEVFVNPDLEFRLAGLRSVPPRKAPLRWKFGPARVPIWMHGIHVGAKCRKKRTISWALAGMPPITATTASMARLVATLNRFGFW